MKNIKFKIAVYIVLALSVMTVMIMYSSVIAKTLAPIAELAVKLLL